MLDPNLPSALCHLDFDNGNVLSEKEKITVVLDFDDLRFAPMVLCLANTVWDVYFDQGTSFVNEYIVTYEQTRPLNELEERFMKPMMLFRHYVIGCKDFADEVMNDALFSRYLEIEEELLASQLFDVDDKISL